MGSGRCRCPAPWACGNGLPRFVAGVQMRCRECAARVAATARVCSRCGAPIVGQHRRVVADAVVADTVVADMVVGAVSDAAGKAVLAGVAGQALPEPYVPGSGDRVPAEFRLVLAGYVGIAGGLFATGLACAAAVLSFSSTTSTTWTTIRAGCCSAWPSLCVFGGSCGRSMRSRRVSGFRGCSGGPAIHTRPR